MRIQRELLLTTANNGYACLPALRAKAVRQIPAGTGQLRGYTVTSAQDSLGRYLRNVFMGNILAVPPFFEYSDYCYGTSLLVPYACPMTMQYLRIPKRSSSMGTLYNSFGESIVVRVRPRSILYSVNLSVTQSINPGDPEGSIRLC